MTIVFLSLVSAIIAERISLRAGLWLLPVFMLVGPGSVLQWYLSEIQGAGDLRFYSAVQAYSVLFLLIALLLPSPYSRGSDLAIVAGFMSSPKSWRFWTSRFSSWDIRKRPHVKASGGCRSRLLDFADVGEATEARMTLFWFPT